MFMTLETHPTTGWSPEKEERMWDLRADRLEALVNLAFLLRYDIANREKTEIYLDMMDRVLSSMTTDEVRERVELERRRYA